MSKCDFCGSKAYGAIFSNGMVEFGFGSRYDWDIYQVNTSKINGQESICDNCFDSILKDDAVIVHALEITVGDDPFWLTNALDIFPGKIQYEIAPKLNDSYKFVLTYNNISYPVVSHVSLGSEYVNSLDYFLLLLHPRETTDPICVLISKRDTEVYNTYVQSGLPVLESDILDYDMPPHIERDLGKGFIPLSYVWLDNNGNLLHEKPDISDRLIIDDGICLYKNSIYQIRTDSGYYLLNNMEDRIDLDSLDGVKCSFSVV